MEHQYKQILGALILLSSSDRAHYNEEVNKRIIAGLLPFLKNVSIETLRRFLRENPATCSEIKMGRNIGTEYYDQPIIVLLYYAFDVIDTGVYQQVPLEVLRFFNTNLNKGPLTKEVA